MKISSVSVFHVLITRDEGSYLLSGGRVGCNEWANKITNKLLLNQRHYVTVWIAH